MKRDTKCSREGWAVEGRREEKGTNIYWIPTPCTYIMQFNPQQPCKVNVTSVLQMKRQTCDVKQLGQSHTANGIIYACSKHLLGMNLLLHLSLGI